MLPGGKIAHDWESLLYGTVLTLQWRLFITAYLQQYYLRCLPPTRTRHLAEGPTPWLENSFPLPLSLYPSKNPGTIFGSAGPLVSCVSLGSFLKFYNPVSLYLKCWWDQVLPHKVDLRLNAVRKAPDKSSWTLKLSTLLLW